MKDLTYDGSFKTMAKEQFQEKQVSNQEVKPSMNSLKALLLDRLRSKRGDKA